MSDFYTVKGEDLSNLANDLREASGQDGQLTWPNGFRSAAQVSGRIPLYETTGNNTDGAMTQKAVTDAISAFSGGIHWRGAVNYYNQLPASPSEGDAYTVLYKGTSDEETDGSEYIWGQLDSTWRWIKLGGDDASGGPFVVTITKHPGNPVTYSANKTFAEIRTAVNSGMVVVANYSEVSNTISVLSLVNGSDKQFTFSSIQGFYVDGFTTVSIFEDGTVSYRAINRLSNVNGKTGRSITLTASDVNALPDNTRYVSSVNGHVGDVSLTADSINAVSSKTYWLSEEYPTLNTAILTVLNNFLPLAITSPGSLVKAAETVDASDFISEVATFSFNNKLRVILADNATVGILLVPTSVVPSTQVGCHVSISMPINSVDYYIVADFIIQGNSVSIIGYALAV